MFLAVVIVNYNGGDLLRQCLQHLCLQTRLPDATLIVDNSSSDDSLNDLPALPGLTVRQAGSNLGFAAANNLAFRELDTADFVVTLNPDTLPQPGFLEALERAAQSKPGYASYACNMLLDEHTIDGRGDCYHITGFAWRLGHGEPSSSEPNNSKEVFAACAGAAMYDYRELLALGGFDESFFCYLEDVDLGYRLRLRGKRCLYVEDASVIHLGSAITGRIPGFATYYGQRNLLWTFVKNTPLPLLLIMLPLHLLATLFTAVVCVSRGEIKVYARAKRDAVCGLGKVWQARRQIQAERIIGSATLLASFNFSLLPARLFRRHPARHKL